MRLERELGTLNRDIIAIKEKWKIALNIDSKKVAIEKLITMRKKLRDSREIKQKIEKATEEELREFAVKKSPQPQDPILDNRDDLDDFSQDIKVESASSQRDGEPAHLTVSWLKNRIKSK